MALLGRAQDLTHARLGSFVTVVYKITPDEARFLARNITDAIPENFFHTVIHSFVTDSLNRKKLGPGHYLFVKSVADELQVEFEAVNNLEVKILNNQRDLQFVLLDLQGKEISKATPQVNGKSLEFDQKMKVFRLAKTNRQGLLEIQYEGHLNLFQLNRSYNNTFGNRLKRRVLYTFPMKQVLAPFRYTFRSVKSLAKGNGVSPPPVFYKVRDWVSRFENGKDFKGFVYVQQPKYKPGDTVRLKAYVTYPKGRFFNRELELRLSRSGSGSFNRKLGKVAPYRPGCYAFDFVLADSLGLRLDETYHVVLDDGRWRHNLPEGEFRFEQYDLKQNIFTIRSLEKEWNPNSTKAIFMKGIDSNDMPLFDVSVDVTLLTQEVINTNAKTMFIPDTLWHHTLKLDHVGETRMDIPDSVFHQASYSCKLKAVFTNSENEQQVRSLELAYDYQTVPVEAKLEDDQIVFAAKNNLVEADLTVFLSKSDTAATRRIRLPHREPINQNVSLYQLATGKSVLAEVLLASHSELMDVAVNRTTDSLKVQVHNPRKLLFRYQLFKGNRILMRGASTRFVYRQRAHSNAHYFLSIQYVWAGEEKELNYNLQTEQKKLNVLVDHSTQVYPGQVIDFKIEVKDAWNKPVAHADVTASAITRKFKNINEIDFRPEEKLKPRKAFNAFRVGALLKPSLQEKLNFDFWNHRLGLDSQAYYQFLYPKGKFINTSPAREGITQVAPFVVKEGKPKTVHYVLVNNVLEFFNQVTNPEPYSFRAPSDTFSIKLRLTNGLLTLPKIIVPEGKKCIVSVDLDGLPAGATFELMENQLTQKESQSLASHFLWIKRRLDQRFAYFYDGQTYRMLDCTLNASNDMVGPFYPGYVTYQGPFKHSFDFKPFRQYVFEPDLIDRDYHEWNPNTLLRDKIADRYWGGSSMPTRPPFGDMARSKKDIDSIFNQYQNTERYDSWPYGKYPEKGHGSLRLINPPNYPAKAVFFLNLTEPDEYYIYPGYTRFFDKLADGFYQVAIVLADNLYIRPTPIHIRDYGKSFYDLAGDSLQPADAFSEKLMEKVRKWASQGAFGAMERYKELGEVRQEFYSNPGSRPIFSNGAWYTGTILASEDGTPLPGVNVVVKGTTIGTVTDVNGYYSVYGPANAVLVFSFIGFTTHEAEGRADLEVKMMADVTQLQEVVVTAYGVTSEKRALSHSVSHVSTTLQGRVAGVVVNGLTAKADTLGVIIRGVNSLTATSKPLVVLDGILVQDPTELDVSKFSVVEILNGEQATALYGARGSNGVILISTRGTSRAELLKTRLPKPIVIPETSVGNSLRKNFKDNAFWKPKLSTNQAGAISFKATMPDDITAWSMQVVALSKGRMGVQNSIIRSFKPLLAQVATPAFLVEGDVAAGIGKITNYTPDSVALDRWIQVSSGKEDSARIVMLNTHVDSLKLVGGSDTLTVRYQIRYKGYLDGELRKLPVIKRGTSEAKGFYALLNDTAFQIPLSNPSGKVIIHAEVDALDVLLNEIQQIKLYPYDCNEQTASKLRALLAEKSILKYRNERFCCDKKLEAAIRKLEQNQNGDGGWGWWEQGASVPWISEHVAGALEWAKRLGFTIRYNQTSLKKHLAFGARLPLTVNSLSGSEVDQTLRALTFAAKLGEKIEAQPIADSLRKFKLVDSEYRELLLARLLQTTGNQVDLENILGRHKQTIRGSWYWGTSQYTLWNNNIDNTLLAYKIIEKANPSSPDLMKVRQYFVEGRQRGWRNTYESARIIETILPGLLEQGPYHGKPVLKFEGDLNQTVSKFPFHYEANQFGKLRVSTSGTGQVYFAAYYEEWNQMPERKDSEFVVNTAWQFGDSLLQAGKPENLLVTVQVHADADYVMISVPIPAGCSYSEKTKLRTNGEVHREYDVHETRIYAERLKVGTYTYKIPLLPRYNGQYTLNPAKAEWMYFPIKFGRNEGTVVKIQ